MKVPSADNQQLLNAFFKNFSPHLRSILFLDYDGTLAPFRQQRDQAVPYPAAKSLLQDLLAIPQVRCVVISGRGIRDLLPLLDLPTPPEIWGSHGWERLTSAGEHQQFEIPQLAQAGLKAALEWALKNLPEDRVEEKPACLALHWRGLDEHQTRELATRANQALQPLAKDHNLELKTFDGGLELRVSGRHKGMAVAAVLQEESPETPAAYLGDDLTDEDAFQTLAGRDLALTALVRAEIRPSHACLHLRPPDQLIDFLQRWRDAYRGPDQTHQP